MTDSNVSFYEVGGCVRDSLLGIRSKDIDYSVEAPSYEAMKRAIVLRCGGDPDNADSVAAIVKVEKPEFATIRAVDPKRGGVDFVLCRKDGFYSDGRRPDSVTMGTLADDLARRDFTVNALARADDGQIIDLFGGQRHLKLRLLVCVGDTEKRMREDALRMLRALRFHLTKGFTLGAELSAFLECQDNAELLAKVSIERVREELVRCFDYNTPEALVMLNRFYHIRNHVFSRNLKLIPTVFQK